MSIDTVSGSTATTQQVQGAQRHHHRGGGEGGLFESVSSTLNMSAKDIATQVRSGKSLLDIATAQGVSKGDLIGAIEKGAPEGLKANATDATWEAIATKAGPPAGGPGGVDGPHAHGHHHGAGERSGVASGTLTRGQSDMLDGLAGLLGQDSSSLLTSLQGGGDLSGMLAAKNVDATDLAGVIEKGFMLDAKA